MWLIIKTHFVSASTQQFAWIIKNKIAILIIYFKTISLFFDLCSYVISLVQKQVARC